MDKEKDYESKNYYSLNSVKKNIIAGNKNSFTKLVNANNEIDIGQYDAKSRLIAENSNVLLQNETNCENLHDCIVPTHEVKNAENGQVFNAMQTNKTDLEQNREHSNKTTFKLNNFLNNLHLNKLFATKNSKVAISIVILAILLVMFLNLSSGVKSPQTTTVSKNYNSLEYVSSKLYVENLEKKLVEVLSKIKGAGDVNVMITLETGPELKIANSVDERTNTSSSATGGSTTSVTVVENPIIISQNGQSSPLVLMEIVPVIKGVVVVAAGAGNIKTKLELLEAVQSLLKISNNNIQIYQGI